MHAEYQQLDLLSYKSFKNMTTWPIFLQSDYIEDFVMKVGKLLQIYLAITGWFKYGRHLAMK